MLLGDNIKDILIGKAACSLFIGTVDNHSIFYLNTMDTMLDDNRASYLQNP